MRCARLNGQDGEYSDHLEATAGDTCSALSPAGRVAASRSFRRLAARARMRTSSDAQWPSAHINAAES